MRQFKDALQLKNIKETLDMEMDSQYKNHEVTFNRNLILQRNLGVSKVCDETYHGD